MALYKIVGVFPILDHAAYKDGLIKWRSPRTTEWGSPGHGQGRIGDVLSDAHHNIEALKEAGVMPEEVLPAEPKPEASTSTPAPVTPEEITQ